MTIRVVLVDDQELIRTGFRMTLGSQPGIEVVGEAGDGVDALDLVARVDADVVLMDVRMPTMDGIEATRRICAGAGPRVLILTTFDHDEYVYAALQAGASGFLLKDSSLTDLVSAIGHVHSGDAVVAPSTTRRLIEHFAQRGPGAIEKREVPDRLRTLTPREREVLMLVARGLSNAEIAGGLVVSELTVKTHVSRILMKLNLRDRVQAVVLSYEAGLIEAGGR